MPSPQPLTLLSMSGSDLSAVLPYLAAVVTGLLGFYGARFTATAPLQSSLNDAFRSLMEELQTQHARDIARISEQENEIARLSGELRASQQRERSMLNLTERVIDSEKGEQ